MPLSTRSLLNEGNMNMLTLAGLYESTDFPCTIQVDSYVPIRFRTQADPLGGARYIRLGNFENNLLEIIVPRDSMVVRGFTVTLAHSIGNRALSDSGCGESLYGLPILEFPSGTEFHGPEASRRLDLRIDFSLCVLEDSVEIQIGDEGEFELEVVHKNVQFLFLRNELKGIRLRGLTVSDIRILSEIGQSRP